ncbi:MAG: hypothetical protein ACPGO5_02035 [Patescibacteria group bacterium]
MAQSPQQFEDFTEGQLKFGYWFTRNRVMIKAIALSLGFLLAGGLVFYNIKQFIDFYGLDEIGTIQQQITDTSLLSGDQLQRYSPRPLQWRTVQIVTREQGVYDILVEVVNPNEKHWMPELRVAFTAGSWQSEELSEYILPREQKTLMLLSVDDPDLVNAFSNSQGVKVVTVSEQWKRIRDNTFYVDGRFIDIGLSADAVTTKQLTPTTRELSFDIMNDSVYNYRNVDVRAILLSGQRIVGVAQLQASEVRSGQAKPMSVRWFYSIPQVTGWRVELSTNLLDPDNILPFTIEQFE